MRPLPGLVCAVVLLGAAPASAQVRKFGDWLAACDNTRNCAAYSLNRDRYHAYMRIRRDGNPSADAEVTIAISADKPLTIRIETDDPATSLFPVGPLTALTPERDGHARIIVETKPAPAIAASLRKATKLDIFRIEPPTDDPKIDGIILTGAHAALAWIDERQKRTGTETAFVKRGARSVAVIPEPPDLPVVVSAKADATPVPRQHPPEVLRRGNAACGREQRGAEHVKTVRLGASGLLYSFFCGQYSGSASLNHAFLLVPDGKPAAKPRFVMAPQAAALIRLGEHKLVKTRTAVFNPDFDPDTLRLSSFFPLRGAGDCGEIIDWIWNGREFHVSEVRLMPHCEGIPASDWPVLYRTQVR